MFPESKGLSDRKQIRCVRDQSAFGHALIGAMLQVADSIVKDRTTLMAGDEFQRREQTIENVARSSFQGRNGTSLAINNEA